MNSLQQIKLSQYITNQKSTVASIARSIGSIENDLGNALIQQAYARKNPDLVVDAGLLAVLDVGVDELLTKFALASAKRDDLLAVKNGTMAVDAMIAKYNIDLTAYSNSLV